MSSVLTSPRPLAERYASIFPQSRRLAEEARGVFPGGVTHDSRALAPFPVYVARAEGAHKWAVDGPRLIDYWSGHGALLLGHGHPAVVEAVQRQMARSTHPGACHELEVEWGRWVQRLIPSAERVRFTASGTEATLMALRLARLYTGRPKALKFGGHFHGWHDFLLPGADHPHFAPPPAIPPEVAALTVVAPPNDLGAVERALTEDEQIGCVILEPTGGHFGGVPTGPEFLRGLRELTARLGRLLIFDEVVTGFRVAPGGAQALYGVTPDLTTLAKVLAGGLPGGAVAGRAEVMAGLEARPGKPKMKHPGTFNANPLSAAAGVAALELVATGEPCRRASAAGAALRRGLNELFAGRGIDWIAYGAFSFFRLLPHYTGPRPTDDGFAPYGGALEKLDGPRDLRLVTAFRQAMLLEGVDLMGLAGITTAAHADADVEQTVAAAGRALDQLSEEGLL